MDHTEHITKIFKMLNIDLYERDEILRIALLGAFTGQNIFLLGPPGTGKSMISRRIASIFKESKYFEYLMQDFSIPDDLFGPLSIKELKKDRTVRKIEGYLPTSNFVFLDEIWKANPAILNALLTAINEKIFKNGTENILIPLRILFAASNECPNSKELSAMYDRFSIRIPVNEIESDDNFRNYFLNCKNINTEKFSIPEELQISFDQIDEWNSEIENIEHSKMVLEKLWAIKLDLESNNKYVEIFVSDRRWQKISYLIKASAYFNGRNITNLTDMHIIKYCILNNLNNYDSISNLINSHIKDSIYMDIVNIHSNFYEIYTKYMQNIKYSEIHIDRAHAILDGLNYYVLDNDQDNNMYVPAWTKENDNKTVQLVNIYGKVVNNYFAKYLSPELIEIIDNTQQSNNTHIMQVSTTYNIVMDRNIEKEIEKILQIFDTIKMEFMEYITQNSHLDNIFIPHTVQKEICDSVDLIYTLKKDFKKFEKQILNHKEHYIYKN